MDEGAGVSSGRYPDLAVRRGGRAVQAEVAQGARHAQDQQRLGLLRAQPAEREPVNVEELAAAAGPGFGADRHARGAQHLQVLVDRPDGYLQLPGEVAGGHPAPRLEREHQGNQAIGTHETRARPYC